ncbi:MAG: GTPase HflX [Oscillospiraceae bacterium]|nr:GTPase HflX [Oscillospiraceae bacterium]
MAEPEKRIIEKAVLVGLSSDVFTAEENATEASLEELAALLETAGGECTAKVLQNRHTPDPHSFIGEGKVEEVRQLLETTEANMAIFDNDLSPSQNRALEKLLNVPVLDRSALILDIFAQRAKTREGRLQVELAQYKYLLPRLTGMWTHLERQEGAMGTRGPGETQLETDRRLIRKRITRLEEELADVRRIRATQRDRRIKNSIPVVAIVGYTNAGKSTLLNLLTGAGIPANNRLFDTLDTTTRQLNVSDTLTVLLSDTVGFISKLPHHLVEAFQATLEELRFADVLLHVIDASDPERDAHIRVVEKLISQLAGDAVPVISCYNKCDLIEPEFLPRGENVVYISAKQNRGIENLLSLIEKTVNRGLKHAVFLLPYSMGGQVQHFHETAQVLSCEYEDAGIRMEAICDEETYGRLRAYVTEERA